MTERAVWRPRWYLWCALGLGSLALLHAHLPWLLQGYSIYPVLVVLFALLCLAAALWELPPATMACAAIALTIFSGSWSYLGIPGVPFDRILLAGVALALLLGAPGASRVPRIRVGGVHLLLGLTIVYVAGSAAVAGTVTSEGGFLSLLDEVGAIPFLMLLLAPAIFAGARERNMLLVTLVALGGYLGLTAVFETVGPRSLVFPHYIVTSDAVTPNTRAGGPFRAPITEGFACFACAVACAMAFAQWSGLRRTLAGAVLVLSGLGAFLSLERGVWIAAAASVVAAGFAAPELRRWLAPALVACSLLIGGALLVSPTLAGHTTARTNDKLSVWDRQNQTAAALRMIKTRPLFGFGWHDYPNSSTAYFRQAGTYPMTGFSTYNDPLPLHDTYLSYAVELGLVGAALWLAGVLCGLGAAIRKRGPARARPWKVGLLALGVFYCVLAAFNPLQQPFAALLLWTWAGVASSSELVNTPRAAPLATTA